MKRPPATAPLWRWKLYNNWRGYSRPGRFVRALVKDVVLGTLEGWRLLWRALPLVLVIAAIWGKL